MTIPPVHKEITVPVPPETAFEVFTGRIGSWWPHQTHSIGHEHTADVILEDKLGGRLYEIVDDGTEHLWGSVLAWDPPQQLTVSWHVGRGPEVFTEIDVRFAATDGGTLVTLEHRYWERLGAKGAELRAQYDEGWNPVLDGFVGATNRA